MLKVLIYVFSIIIFSGVGPWLIHCMKGSFGESSQDLSPKKCNIAGENGKSFFMFDCTPFGFFFSFKQYRIFNMKRGCLFLISTGKKPRGPKHCVPKKNTATSCSSGSIMLAI
jgi:hypothetical protein